METAMGNYTLSINRDDRGRIVAEVWHNASGQTVGITECDTFEAARHWGATLVNKIKEPALPAKGKTK